MAEDLTVARPVAAPRPEPQPKPRRVHQRRFLVAYALLVIAVFAAGAMLYVALGVDSEEEQAWSDWKPSGEGESRLVQIGDHVGAGYRAPSGELAARIIAGPPTFTTTDEQGRTLQLPLEGVLVKGRTSDQSDARAVLLSRDSVMYVLCGSGSACQPSQSLLSVRGVGTAYEREALELALYTFKYVPEANSVMVFLPPFPGADPSGALRTMVYLQRHQLESQLGRPIGDTLRAGSGIDYSNAEKNEIIRLVLPRLYTFQPEQAPNGAWILSLEHYGG